MNTEKPNIVQLRPQQIINPEQDLKQVIVQTPLREQLLKNTNYLSIQQKLMQDIKQLYQSDFYQSINVHYGAKSKFQKQNLQQELYQRRKQILKLQINQENQCIKRIMSARSQEDIGLIQKQHLKNLDIIEERRNYFNQDQYIPWIYIDAKKKRPLYGKIFQEFDRRGAAMLKSTIGYRSPFSTFDKIQFNMETLPIEYLRKRKYYVFGLNWMKPIKYKGEDLDIFAATQNSCSPIFRMIDQKKYSASLGIVKGQDRVELEIGKRYPRLFQDIHSYCQGNLFHPSRKLSVKLDRTIQDTLELGDVMNGRYINGKIQSTIPFLSQSNFMKFDYNYRKFYDLYNFSQKFKNQKTQLFFKNSNIQTNFSIKALANLSNYISDLQQKFQVRGFENQRNPDNSVCQLKTSFKLNNYNYPIFGGVGIVPFLYAQGGASIKKQLKKSHLLGSMGIGLSYPLSKFIQIQLLYSLLQAQNFSSRQPVNFQIRIGSMD